MCVRGGDKQAMDLAERELLTRLKDLGFLEVDSRYRCCV